MDKKQVVQNVQAQLFSLQDLHVFLYSKIPQNT